MDPKPYTHSVEHLRDLLEWVRLRLMHVFRAQQKVVKTVGAAERSLPLAFLGDNVELHRLPVDDDFGPVLDGLEEHVRQRVAVSQIELRWEQLRHTFGLDALGEHLLLAALAPSFSSGFQRSFQLVGAPDGPLPVALLADIVASGDEERWRALGELHPDEPLFRAGLLLFASAKPSNPASDGSVVPSPLLFDYLLGRPLPTGRPASLFRFCEVVSGGLGLGDIPLTDEQVRHVRRALQLLPTRPLVLQSIGFDPRTVVAGLAGAFGGAYIRLHYAAAERTREALDVYRQVALLARLYAVPVVLDLSAMEPERLTAATIEFFLDETAGARRVVIARGRVRIEGLSEAHAPVLLDLQRLTHEQRQWAWKAALGDELGEGDLTELARSFALGEREIRECGRRVMAEHELAGRREELRYPAVASVARKVLGRGIEDVADQVPTDSTFEDLIVSPECLVELREVLSYYQHLTALRSTGKLMGHGERGRATIVLFYGPSGTGKTMAAAVLAREAQRDLFRIDVSKIVDKYIGETEKQLDKVFDLAEQSGSIILFDEADTLFSTRTSVKSTQDRYSNMTVNYLLQRVESFSGMCVLTTNLVESIDKAFRRRIPFQIEFPAPDAEGRQRLWKLFLDQAGAPELTDDDLRALADRFEMTGAHIRNAVLKAVVQAVAAGASLDFERLEAAASREYAALGGVVRVNREW